MSGSLFDDRDVVGVPVDEFVPRHWSAIPGVGRLPAGDARIPGVIAEWLRTNTATPALLASIERSRYADVLPAAS